MIGHILPPKVCAVDTTADLLETVLFPEEEAVISRAVDKRRKEFITVRACARAALGELGFPPSPLLPGERGAPRWPVGVVGSMTHCEGYRAAAVSSVQDLSAIGIDAEPNTPLPDGLLSAFTSPGEHAHLSELAARLPEVHWDRLLFSAKEAVYKAWFPLTRRFLSFEEASIDFGTDGSFAARLLTRGASVDGVRLDGFSGRWTVHGGIALTAIAVPRP